MTWWSCSPVAARPAPTETIALQIIRVGFQQNRMSYGSSLAIYMLLIVGLVSITLVLLLRRREEKLVM